MSSTKELLAELDQESALLRYALACQRVARDYIVRSTRFEVGDIQFRHANPQFCEFTVRVAHTLEVVTTTTDYKGLVPAVAFAPAELVLGACLLRAIDNYLTRKVSLAEPRIVYRDVHPPLRHSQANFPDMHHDHRH